MTTTTAPPVRRVRRVVTTEQMKALLDAGATVRLPRVQRPHDEVTEAFSQEDAALLGAGPKQVRTVRYMRDDTVQCIAVEDERHLYLTDGFIPTHNTSNIMFLKSTDDAMLRDLEGMSGSRHVGRITGKTVNVDKGQALKQTATNSSVSYNFSAEKEAVITYNDMAFIPERNSILFRAGDPPVWNRNSSILPMAWRLLSKNQIEHPGHKYTLQTIPTLSSAIDFDVRRNQPDFMEMLKLRISQAERAEQATKIFKEAYGYTDYEFELLDPDVRSDEIMDLITSMKWDEQGIDPDEMSIEDIEENDIGTMNFMEFEHVEEFEDVVTQTKQLEARKKDLDKKRYAQGQISRSMMVSDSAVLGDDAAVTYPHTLDREIITAYKATKKYLQKDDKHFRAGPNSLSGVDGALYISRMDESESLAALQGGATDPNKRVYAENGNDFEGSTEIGTFTVHDAFYEFLVGLESWTELGNGRFDHEMAQRMRSYDEIYEDDI